MGDKKCTQKSNLCYTIANSAPYKQRKADLRSDVCVDRIESMFGEMT